MSVDSLAEHSRQLSLRDSWEVMRYRVLPVLVAWWVSVGVMWVVLEVLA